MKLQKNVKHTIVFGILIFFTALVGQRVAHGYIHPADPIIVLAAMMLPLPHAMTAVGLASLAADLVKGFYLLAPVTLILKLLMVLAVKALLKTKPAQKHPEILAAPALLIPIPGFYLAELIFRLFAGDGAKAFANAAITLKADALQAGVGVLLLIFLYDMIQGIRSARAQLRQAKEKEESADEDT
ncbi:MAG: ECF transporter S component [Clostridia bacterium]|nr:ECF transporter S component [Clostridia bacterium]